MARSVPDAWSFRFDATELEARAQIVALRDALSLANVDTGSLGAIEIALSEAINNIVEHAYMGQTDGQIELTCQIESARIDIFLRDFGKPMPNNAVPPAKAPGVDVALCDLPEGGFGWFLIHQLATRLEYNRLEICNELYLGFDLPAGVSNPAV